MGSVPIVYLTRSEVFSACHRLHSDAFDEKTNREIYGKCNNYHGHGHNYKVEVTVRGPVSEETGMIINIADLKNYIKIAIMDVLDHKNIDRDVPYFKDRVSTTENLAVFIWKQLTTLLPQPEILYEVKIFETDKNTVTYRGE